MTTQAAGVVIGRLGQRVFPQIEETLTEGACRSSAAAAALHHFTTQPQIWGKNFPQIFSLDVAMFSIKVTVAQHLLTPSGFTVSQPSSFSRTRTITYMKKETLKSAFIHFLAEVLILILVAT